MYTHSVSLRISYYTIVYGTPGSGSSKQLKMTSLQSDDNKTRVCKEVLRFNTMPCRHMPFLVHF